MSANDGGQAFPRACGQCGSDVEGMTKREVYAKAAMQGYLSGLLANPKTFVPDLKQDQIAKVSFSIADAMIAFDHG